MPSNSYRGEHCGARFLKNESIVYLRVGTWAEVADRACGDHANERRWIDVIPAGVTDFSLMGNGPAISYYAFYLPQDVNGKSVHLFQHSPKDVGDPAHVLTIEDSLVLRIYWYALEFVHRPSSSLVLEAELITLLPVLGHRLW